MLYWSLLWSAVFGQFQTRVFKSKYLWVRGGMQWERWEDYGRLWSWLARRKALSWTLEVSDVGRMKDSEGSCDTEDTLKDFLRKTLGSTLKVHSLLCWRQGLLSSHETSCAHANVLSEKVDRQSPKEYCTPRHSVLWRPCVPWCLNLSLSVHCFSVCP